MSDNVRSLTGKMPTQLGIPNEGLIGTLEDALRRARSGELQSFVGTGFTAAGHRLSVWSDHHENVYEMLGSIAWLHSEYVQRHTEVTE